MTEPVDPLLDAEVSGGVVEEGAAPLGSPSSVAKWWVAGSWTAAGLLAAAASLFTVMTVYTANAGMSSSSTVDFTVYSTATAFDAWGHTSTAVTSVTSGSPTGAGGPVFVVPGGPSYGIVLCVCAVTLLVASVSTAFPGRFGLPSLLRGLGPVGAGVLCGVGACQVLAFYSSSRPFVPPGSPLPVAGPSSTWQLGPCTWLTLAAALLALTIWLLSQHHRTRGAGPWQGADEISWT